MKAIENICSGLFIIALFVLSTVSIMGVWSVVGQDVILKSFQTLTLLAVVAAIVVIAGRYMDHSPEDAAHNASVATIFKIARNSTLGVLIVSAVLLVFLALLSIWGAIPNSDVIVRSFTSLGIIAFAAFISVVVCLERENHLLGKPKSVVISGWTIFVLFVLFWFCMTLSQTFVPSAQTSYNDQPFQSGNYEQQLLPTKTEKPTKTNVITLDISTTKRIAYKNLTEYALPSNELATRDGKDVVLVELTLTAGEGCANGCSTQYIQGFDQDYQLSTSAGSIATIGRSTTATFITNPDKQVMMYPGQTMKRQAYFYVSPTDTSFIFRYIGKVFVPTEVSYAFSLPVAK